MRVVQRIPHKRIKRWFPDTEIKNIGYLNISFRTEEQALCFINDTLGINISIFKKAQKVLEEHGLYLYLAEKV